MQIQYFGLSSFRIQTRQATIITDPFDKKSGLTPPRGSADILILAQKTNPLYSAVSGISGNPFTITNPGGYNTKEITVTGLPLEQDGGFLTIYLIESENVKILNLGHLQSFTLKEEDLESLGDIDILILPVGGKSVMDAAAAAKAVSQIEPKIVIPSHYEIPGLKLPADKPDKFLKDLGAKNQPEEKLSVKKKDLLLLETTQVALLQPLR